MCRFQITVIFKCLKKVSILGGSSCIHIISLLLGIIIVFMLFEMCAIDLQ